MRTNEIMYRDGLWLRFVVHHSSEMSYDLELQPSFDEKKIKNEEFISH